MSVKMAMSAAAWVFAPQKPRFSAKAENPAESLVVGQPSCLPVLSWESQFVAAGDGLPPFVRTAQREQGFCGAKLCDFSAGPVFCG
jgi:hypothetical protein